MMAAARMMERAAAAAPVGITSDEDIRTYPGRCGREKHRADRCTRHAEVAQPQWRKNVESSQSRAKQGHQPEAGRESRRFRATSNDPIG